jgi:hypothetical protein
MTLTVTTRREASPEKRAYFQFKPEPVDVTVYADPGRAASFSFSTGHRSIRSRSAGRGDEHLTAPGVQ